MKSLIFLTVVMLCSTTVSAQGFFEGMLTAATGMVTQTMNMGLSMFKAAVDLIPFEAGMQMAKEILMTAKDFPEQMINIFMAGAEQAEKYTGSAAEQAQKSFLDAAKQVEELKEAGAPKADYFNLMDKMKEVAATMK